MAAGYRLSLCGDERFGVGGGRNIAKILLLLDPYHLQIEYRSYSMVTWWCNILLQYTLMYLLWIILYQLNRTQRYNFSHVWPCRRWGMGIMISITYVLTNPAFFAMSTRWWCLWLPKQFQSYTGLWEKSHLPWPL